MSGRIRTIKPELLEDERVAALSDRAFRLYVAAILSADDYGNLRAEPRQLRGLVYWALDEVTPHSVQEARDEMLSCGLIRGYRVRGQTYAHISGWSKHQRMDNAGKPRMPGENDPESTPFPTSLDVIDSSPRAFESSPPVPQNSPLAQSSRQTTVHRPPTTDPEEITPLLVLDEGPGRSTAQVVFDRYLAGWRSRVRGKRAPEMLPKREAMIHARLKRFSPDELTQAIDALWASDWHVAEGQTHFELVLRSDSQVEKFLGMADRNHPSGVRPVVPPAKEDSERPADDRPMTLDEVARLEMPHADPARRV